MKIASFNANGIRARMPIVLDWLDTQRPDVLALQETKVQDPDFPAESFEAMGYHVLFKGQKSYNGVAVVSQTPPLDVEMAFGDESFDAEPRLIKAVFGPVTVVNTYVPQGQAPDSDKFQYKLAWLKRLQTWFETRFTPDTPLIWTGDFNVAPKPIDVHDPKKLLGSVGYHPDEHRMLSAIEAWGFLDVYRKHKPEDPTFTFWDYRVKNAVQRGLGWRIDHIWATLPAAGRSKSAWIDTAPRLVPRPSDHTFIVAEFDF